MKSGYADVHCHALGNVDDGAPDEARSEEMIRIAYEDGVRVMCMTPHFSPYHYGDTSKKSAEAFARLSEWVSDAYPDMKLYLGHELGYYPNCVQALSDGYCRTLNGSRYVLVDFPEAEEFDVIRSAAETLSRAGYVPVLAHTERYRSLFSRLDWIRQFIEDGGVVQVNASSAVGGWGFACKRQWKKLIRGRLVHVVSTDAHNTTTRPPRLSVCFKALTRYCSPEETEDLTRNNALRILANETI